MATGILRNTTIIGVETEVTEGTYVAPSAATSYVQPLADGFELTPSKELIERNILTSSIGQVTPRTGIKSVAGSLPVEFRGSGVEGEPTDFDPLLRACLGSYRQIATQTTSDTGHTTTQINLDAITVLKFAVGDIIVVLDAGDHTVHAVTAVDTGVGTESITILPARDSAPADNVVISKTSVYYPANDGHPSLSLSYYWGNEIRETAVGARVSTMALENFTTGQLASLNFAFEGLSFDEIDGAAPHTPDFDSALPPLILGACVYQNGTRIKVNSVSLTVANTLGFITSTCNPSGRESSRFTERTINFTIDPYKDDTSVDQFTKFDQNEAYSLFLYAYNPGSTAGEIELGSCVGIYLPNCLTTAKTVGDNEGVLIENIEGQATRGESGEIEEIYVGFV
jgi:hypothetical protein